MLTATLTDAEVDEICAGLRQNAAKVRFLREVLKLSVSRKPNGRPLVSRADWDRRTQQGQAGRPANGPKWSRAA